MTFLPSFPAGISQLNARDADFIYNESDGHLGHLIAVYFFDTSQYASAELTRVQAVDWVTARLGFTSIFTQRIQRVPLGLDHPYWTPAADYDIDRHVHVTAVTEPGWAPLHRHLSAITATRMDLDRPPWELHVFTGITGLDDLPGRLTAVAVKAHHSAGDGLAIRALGENLFSNTVRPATFQRSISFLRTRLLVSALRRFPGRITQFVKTLAQTRTSAHTINEAAAGVQWEAHLRERPATRFNGRVSGRVSLGSFVLSGAEVQAIKVAVPGATVNDVLLAAVGGAMMRYLTDIGERPAGSLVAMVPRSMRQQENWKSANQLVTMSVDMHTETDDPLDRLGLIAESSRSEKTRTSHAAVRHFGTRFDSAPAPLLRLFAYARNQYHYDTERPRYQHTTVSNIPLSVDGLTFNDAPGAAVLAIQPPVDGDGLRHFLVATAGGGLTLNVIADAETMPDLGLYLLAIRESFDELRKAAANSPRSIRQEGCSEPSTGLIAE